MWQIKKLVFNALSQMKINYFRKFEKKQNILMNKQKLQYFNLKRKFTSYVFCGSNFIKQNNLKTSQVYGYYQPIKQKKNDKINNFKRKQLFL